jgi:nucleoside-diphosphate-sugar epimerase
MKVLTTGKSGFLLRNTLSLFDWEIIEYEFGKSYEDIDLVLHFGSPTDIYDLSDKEKTAFSMIDLTIKVVYESISNNCRIIFASSMGAEFLEDEYSIYKRAMEQYISANVDDHLILRIPRVYGFDKQKGLMKRIRLNEIPETDLNNKIEYIDILDFTHWFKRILSEKGVKYYNEKKRNNTIKERKDIYCK